jgi:hypothetical protein
VLGDVMPHLQKGELITCPKKDEALLSGYKTFPLIRIKVIAQMSLIFISL